MPSDVFGFLKIGDADRQDIAEVGEWIILNAKLQDTAGDTTTASIISTTTCSVLV